MSFIFNDGAGSTLMTTVANGGAAVYRLKELLKTAGWEIQSSSDGTNVSNTPGNGNDQITSAAEMNTNNAWFVIKQPTMRGGHGPGERQFIIRRGTSDTSWLIAYVPLDGSNAAQTPTASGTTVAVPTFTSTYALIGTLPDTTAAWFAASPGNRRWQIGADASDPYGFFFLSWTTGGAGVGGLVGAGLLVFDPLEIGTYDSGDADPFAIICTNQATSSPLNYTVLDVQAAGPATTFGASPAAFYRKSLTGELFLPHSIGAHLITTGGNNVWQPSVFGANPYNPRREVMVPMIYMRGARSSGVQIIGTQYKGSSSILRFKPAGLLTGMLLTRSAPDDRCVVADVTIPWDSAVVPSWS